MIILSKEEFEKEYPVNNVFPQEKVKAGETIINNWLHEKFDTPCKGIVYQVAFNKFVFVAD